MHARFLLVPLSPLLFVLGGCSLITVADAAVSVVATTVKVGATVVGTTVEVAAAGVKAVATSPDEKEKEREAGTAAR